MINIKLVVIGDSNVGKTSLRTQYISGRFASGYRATIGADFITKTIPHPWIEGETIMLQIWDTAGQERFSSLSSAFFRGADAVLMMFDVNKAPSLLSLKKWWTEFARSAPVEDMDAENFCCVAVGNKIDLLEPGSKDSVTQGEAQDFFAQLIPVTPSTPPSPQLAPQEPFLSLSRLTSRSPTRRAGSADVGDDMELRRSPSPSAMRSNSIAISNARPSSPKHGFSKSRSRSSSRFFTGTMSTARTTLTIYHTPSSSIYDDYHSARSSPEASSGASIHARRSSDESSLSTTSALTITPSLFTRDNRYQSIRHNRHSSVPPAAEPSSVKKPDKGAKLFYTSAKSGEGVSEVFEYIAQRVLVKWAYDERLESGRLHFRDATSETIYIGDRNDRPGLGKLRTSCC